MKDKGIQGVCEGVIIMVESRLGRERNEVMGRGIENQLVVGCMESTLKCENERPGRLKVETRNSFLELRL